MLGDEGEQQDEDCHHVDVDASRDPWKSIRNRRHSTRQTGMTPTSFKKQSLKSVHVSYNNSFRILHHLPSRCSSSFLFVSNYIKSFNELIR